MRVHSIADVAAAARGRRMDLNLSQSALAERTGISRKWISEFEAGKPTVELALVIRALEGLGLEVELGIDKGSHAAPMSPRTSAVAETQHTQPHIDLDVLLEAYRRE